MKTIKYKELKRRYQLDGAERTVAHLSEALSNGDLKPDDFSIRDLAEGLIPDGHQWVRELDPRSGSGISVTEAIEAVDVTAFLNISGQVVYSKILESYNQETFAVSKMVSTIPTRLDGEKLPGVAAIADSVSAIAPGMPYPHVGFGEDYIETPSTTKQGFIVPVTKEAIFFDRTHLILSRAAEVGEVLALNKEKRILDTVLGLKNSYKWMGTAYNTYYGAATDPWVNMKSGNALKDWQSVDTAESVLANIVDPNTKEPILAEPDAVLVMPKNRYTAHRIFHAAEYSSSPTGSDFVTTVPNPFRHYRIVASRLAFRRLVDSGLTETVAGDCWFIGNFRKAFAYMENWPITVTQSATGSEADFNQDIVIRFKASERGTPAVLNPRYVLKCTA
ncbi:MAG: hypothetical protein FWC50_02595 [Planctomycetaceae bacterium]|nr:hypothetical protein [Planctomycetaceae bacterium]